MEDFDFDSTINLDEIDMKEGQGERPTVVVPKGYYKFKVCKVEKATHQPKAGGKLPPCKMVKLSLMIEVPEGVAFVNERLFLHSSTMWKVLQFFICVGLIKSGAKSIVLPWDDLNGAEGVALIDTSTWTNKDGEEIPQNDAKAFVKPEETANHKILNAEVKKSAPSSSEDDFEDMPF